MGLSIMIEASDRRSSDVDQRHVVNGSVGVSLPQPLKISRLDEKGKQQ